MQAEHLWRQGWLTHAYAIPSPNFDERPPDTTISLLVIHNISLPPEVFGGPAVADLFRNDLDLGAHAYFDGLRGLKVSSHFFIRRAGTLVQFVGCDQRAWHAGQSRWKGRERCNDFSIGIELEGSDYVPFTKGQYDSLAELTAQLKSIYPIEDVVGHSDIAPGRKTDPGPHFDWQRLQLSLPTPR